MGHYKQDYYLGFLSDTIISWGFTLNRYDQYMANKTLNGRQCTIIWHVDDLKIPHVEKDLVEGIISNLNNKFGKESHLTTTCSKVLEYLGLKIDHGSKGKV